MGNSLVGIRLILGIAVLCSRGPRILRRPRRHRCPTTSLNPGDELEVAVWKEPDLTKKVIVRPDGKISFPLTGDVLAIGRTVGQVQTELATN